MLWRSFYKNSKLASSHLPTETAGKRGMKPAWPSGERNRCPKAARTPAAEARPGHAGSQGPPLDRASGLRVRGHGLSPGPPCRTGPWAKPRVPEPFPPVQHRRGGTCFVGKPQGSLSGSRAGDTGSRRVRQARASAPSGFVRQGPSRGHVTCGGLVLHKEGRTRPPGSRQDGEPVSPGRAGRRSPHAY